MRVIIIILFRFLMNNCSSSPSPLWWVKRCLWTPPSPWRSEREITGKSVSACKLISFLNGQNHQLLMVNLCCRYLSEEIWGSGFFSVFSSPAPHLVLSTFKDVTFHRGIFFVNNSELPHVIVNACCKQLVFELVLEGLFCIVFPVDLFFQYVLCLWVWKSNYFPWCDS